MGAPPNLTPEQRRAALAKAAQARRERAEFKAAVKVGNASWLDALDSDSEALQRLRVRELIESIPGLGEVRAAAVMERAGISSARRVQGLGRAQRSLLHEILRNRS